MKEVAPYQPKNKIRIVTAASLFDGHDAAINIMRRIIQASGAEVIHLGHDRSVSEIVNCAIQEDANAIAITSYQGGHMEYFKYMFDLLKERGQIMLKFLAVVEEQFFQMKLKNYSNTASLEFTIPMTVVQWVCKE